MVEADPVGGDPVASDPVSVALAERRARRAERIRTAVDADLHSICADAAERRLQVRAHLAGGTVLTGTACDVSTWSLTLESAAGPNAVTVTSVLLDGLTRLSVRDLGLPAHRSGSPPHQARPESLLDWLDAAVTQRLVVRLWTSDGACTSGKLASAGTHLVGLDQAAGGADRTEPSGGWSEWLNPADVVAYAAID